ncbi:NfeD family protein [Antrihabitans spumae]|uniref:NfeD family protein n=1 Tax=Antrihabitans spumae TaxID=3373370 RepID=A0ABW7JWD7_9NOCA
MTAVLIACFAVGVVALAGSLVVGEFGGDHQIGAGGHGDGISFLSLTTIATAIFGFGAGGLGTKFAGGSDALQISVGAAASVGLVALFRGLLLPYLQRQQSNSHFGRSSYIGLLGRVELSIPVDGWGEVSFVDPDGSRVRAKAKSAEPNVLPTASRIYITDVDDEFVHVVAVPEI